MPSVLTQDAQSKPMRRAGPGGAGGIGHHGSQCSRHMEPDPASWRHLQLPPSEHLQAADPFPFAALSMLTSQFLCCRMSGLAWQISSCMSSWVRGLCASCRLRASQQRPTTAWRARCWQRCTACPAAPAQQPGPPAAAQLQRWTPWRMASSRTLPERCRCCHMQGIKQ